MWKRENSDVAGGYRRVEKGCLKLEPDPCFVLFGRMAKWVDRGKSLPPQLEAPESSKQELPCLDETGDPFP